jgi:hypothetical protein
MHSKLPHERILKGQHKAAAIAWVGAFLCCAGSVVAQTDPNAAAAAVPPTEAQMPDALRLAVKKVIVIAGQGPASETVKGSYEQETAGLVGGADAGSRMGTISKEIGGVPINIPIPGLAIPGAIFGGITGATKREIQEFRDALTEELVSAESPQLRSDGLAIDVFWAIRKRPGLESHLFSPKLDIPGDTDAVLYVNFNDVTIDVQRSDAIITASAAATLRRLSDGQNVYQSEIRYQDRASLGDWTDNDNALWREYTNFARYYLGREIAADFFNRVKIDHELLPLATDSAKPDRKNKRKFVSESQMPTLAWELKIQGATAYEGWPETVDEANIFYDIEIFDDRQLVYDAQKLPDPEHTLTYELDACQGYRWSVRPSYHINGEVRFGEWMRFARPAQNKPDPQTAVFRGIAGEEASEAHAYISDFPLLEIECGRR